MMQFAVGRKLVPANPAKGVQLLKGDKKERFLSEAEVAKLADTLAAMERDHRLNPTAAAAVRLLLLTGCRKSEILTLRWDWVDFERASFYVLPAAKGAGHYTGLQKDWERTRVRAGLSGLRLHDLRHSFASFAVADGHTLFMVGKVLGHKQARTTEGYAHLADDPVRAVAERTAARIAAAMKGASGGAPVINISK